MSNYIKGLDISTIQGVIDFKAVVASGIQFVSCRCGVGNDGVDGRYEYDIANAKAAGLKVMAYHFVYPLPTIAGHEDRDPIAQANAHFKAAKGELACCDLEWPIPKDWSKWNCNASQIKAWAKTYLEEYSRLDGRTMMIYTYPDFAQNLKLDPEFAKYSLWIASYLNSPTIPAPWTDWVLWQMSGGAGHLPNGVAVDTDYAKDLSLWDIPITPPEKVIVLPSNPPPQVTPPVTPVNNSPIPTQSSKIISCIRRIFNF